MVLDRLISIVVGKESFIRWQAMIARWDGGAIVYLHGVQKFIVKELNCKKTAEIQHAQQIKVFYRFRIHMCTYVNKCKFLGCRTHAD